MNYILIFVLFTGLTFTQELSIGAGPIFSAKNKSVNSSIGANGYIHYRFNEIFSLRSVYGYYSSSFSNSIKRAAEDTYSLNWIEANLLFHIPVSKTIFYLGSGIGYFFPKRSIFQHGTLGTTIKDIERGPSYALILGSNVITVKSLSLNIEAEYFLFNSKMKGYYWADEKIPFSESVNLNTFLIKLIFEYRFVL
jgi:hypothetical protein